MMTPQLFRQDPNDPAGGVLVSPIGLLMLAAGAVDAPDGKLLDKARGAVLFAELLSAARAGGFVGADAAATVLLGNFNLNRKAATAANVFKHICPEAYFAALNRAGFDALARD